MPPEQPVTLDMSTAQPIQQTHQPVTLDMSTAKPIDSPGTGLGMGGQPLTDRTVPNARLRNLPNPVDPSWGPGRALYEGAKTGLELGAIPATAGQPIASVARGALGATAGSLAGKTAAKMAGGGDLAQEVSGDVGGVVGGGLTEGLANTRVGKTVGKVIGGTIEDIPGVRQLGKLKGYWDETAPQPTFSDKPLGPAAPPDELRQANALSRGSSSPRDPAAGLGKIPVKPGQAGQLAASMEKPAASATSDAGFKRGSLGDLLDKSLGAKKLEPNVPLRQQMGATAAPDANAGPSGDVLEGHTPTQSSWIKSYKYDPATREFEMAPKSGTPVRLGDVSPEDAQGFADAKSQGKAWQQIKNNPLVAKRINGKWTPVKAAQ